MTDMKTFVKNNCVHSRLAERPIVGQWEHLKLVFIHGYPMTLRGFYVMASKAIFGAKLPMSPMIWNELHAETKLLCEGLGHRLQEGREANSVIEGIRAASDWNSTTAGVRPYNQPIPIHRWVESVEQQIAALDGVTLPGPQLQ